MRRAKRRGDLVSVLLAFFLCAMTGTGLVWAHDETAALQVIRPLTVQLLKLAEALSKAPQQAKLHELQETIEARRDALLALMEHHPAMVLEVALPDAVRKSLPEELQARLEHQETLEGELTVLVSSNFELKVAQTLYELTTDRGEHVGLHFAGEGPDLLTGSRVRVHGVQLENQMALDPANSSTQTITAAEVAPLTIKKVAVILVNFQDKAIQPYTPSTAKSVMFTTTNAYYQEVSFGKTKLEGFNRPDGDIFGWYTVPINSPRSCDGVEAWTDAAGSLARNDGFNPANYSNEIYLFPRVSGCNYGGQGTLGGRWSAIFGVLTTRAVGHELGHNFGLHLQLM